MTLRAPSRYWQWVVWLVAAALVAAAYVVLKRIVFGDRADDILSPYSQRILLPAIAVFLLVAWETRWDGIVRTGRPRHERKSAHVHEPRHRHHGVEKVKVEGEGRGVGEGRGGGRGEGGGGEVKAPTSAAEGYYLAARQIEHRKIPDPELDRAYLEMLGKAALAGYGRALEKFGTYALRREEWLESYYWLWQAQRRGVRNLEPSLRKARKHWVKEGFPRQARHPSAIFTAARAEVARALLCLVSGHDAAVAREFLKTHSAEDLG